MINCSVVILVYLFLCIITINKQLSLLRKRVVRKIFIVVILMVERSHGFYRSSLSVGKSRVESGVQCVTNGAENSNS